MERYAVGSSAKADRRRLEAAGFDPVQAEALLQMIGDSQEALATKQDLASVQGALTKDIAEVRADLSDLATTVAQNSARIDALERAMEALRQEVRDRFESFRQEIAGQMDGLRGEMSGLRGEIDGLRGEFRSELRALKWMFGTVLALMAPMVGGIIALALR
ncbi:MAG: DUF1640 domain-containing protein [Holophagales bacterium]|nr:DUF1640 domain-containing protein [Holophagales bacterium]MYF96197.1 DUF1640 domain-containing protein [Holophagales bacterium]